MNFFQMFLSFTGRQSPQYQGSSIKGPVLRKAFQKFQFPLKSYLRLSTVVICRRTTLRLAVFNNMSGGWSNTGCPSRGPGFHSQRTTCSDTVWGNPTPSSGIHEHCTHVVHRHSNTHTHTGGSGNRRDGSILKVLAAFAEDPVWFIACRWWLTTTHYKSSYKDSTPSSDLSRCCTHKHAGKTPKGIKQKLTPKTSGWLSWGLIPFLGNTCYLLY